MLTKLRSSVLHAVFSAQQKLREPNLLVTVGYVQHRVNAASAAIYNTLAQLRQTVFQCDLFTNSWSELRLPPSNTRQGPLTILHKLFRFLGWTPSATQEWTWGRAQDVSVSLLQHRASFLHEVRRSLRFAVVQGVHRRKDTNGLLGSHLHLDYNACTYPIRTSEHARVKFFRPSRIACPATQCSANCVRSFRVAHARVTGFLLQACGIQTHARPAGNNVKSLCICSRASVGPRAPNF